MPRRPARPPRPRPRLPRRPAISRSAATTPTPVEAKGMVAIDAAFTTATGIAVTSNTVDHDTFQNQINTYLGATPDDVFTWFSGYRMRFFADQGLVTADRRRLGQGQEQLHRRLRDSRSIGDDGKVYGIPVDYYPWASSTARACSRTRATRSRRRGTTYKTLCAKMQTDGLTPIAFGDKDGWPAMGTFDILNLRLNGYDFHVGLHDRQARSGPTRRSPPSSRSGPRSCPYHDNGYAGLTWQKACDTLLRKKSGMLLPRPLPDRRVLDVRHAGRPGRPRLLPVPDPRHAYDAEAALDAPDRHLDDQRQVADAPAGHGQRQGLPGVLRQGLDPDPHVPEPARASSRPARTPTRAATARCRRRPSSSSARPRRSPSSSIATRARTSPARRACRASCRPSSRTRPQDTTALQKPRCRTSGISCRSR